MYFIFQDDFIKDCFYFFFVGCQLFEIFFCICVSDVDGQKFVGVCLYVIKVFGNYRYDWFQEIEFVCYFFYQIVFDVVDVIEVVGSFEF